MICNHHIKVAVVVQQITMANSPVDRNTDLMHQTTGAKVLITDRASDKYLEAAKRHGTERYDRWCGGPRGFDDWCERMH